MSENRPYDIFISYRRQGGAEYVRPLKAELELRGYNVFLDYDELKDGVFDKRIMDAIEQAPIFVFMLSAHSLDRCVNDDDWVRKEIEFAVSKKRHFVPVNPNKEFDGFPDNVPEQVKQSLGQHQFSHIDFEQLFKSSVREMDEYRIRPILKERLREQPKSSAGARVTIETDLDCRILHFGKQIGTALCGEFPEIRLQKGKHKLTFVGMECDSDRVEQMLTITDLEFGEFIEVKLRDIYNARKAREEAERKAREEAERRAREEAERKVREEAERKAREEAERKAREEAARKAREEAERRAREDAARKAREEAARKAREEAERRAREEAARKARERAERVARMKKYSVGDYYNDGVREGVVFEVSADGRHGKIVSMEQSVKKLEWASDAAEYKRLIGANSETNGVANMAKVRAISGWRDKYPAFKWCADLGEGWYLPSIEELKMFTLNDAVYDAVNRTLSARGGIKLYNRDEWHGWYWSSTENDKQYDGKFCAWHVDMSNGNTFNNYKDSIIRVRAVATFGGDILEDDVRAFVEKERKAREVAERKAREEAERRRRLGIYAVGDYYNDGVREGVVFEVSADGRHGKIVSMKQSTEGLQWATTERKFGLFKSEAERLIGADSERDGAYNMAKVKAISGWRDKYPAFKWCADLGEGWYLPSKEELKTFTLNDVVHDAVNRTLSARGCARLYNGGELDRYWSSTEDDYKYSSDEVSAWVLVMGEGVFGRFGKKNASYVRAVTVF